MRGIGRRIVNWGERNIEYGKECVEEVVLVYIEGSVGRVKEGMLL